MTGIQTREEEEERRGLLNSLPLNLKWAFLYNVKHPEMRREVLGKGPDAANYTPGRSHHDHVDG